MPVSEAEAIGIIQRWYRCRMRRYRFLTVIRKARRRRDFLAERRRATSSLHTHESELIEMKNLLHQPGGARLVNEWWDVREGKAAQTVQSRWRAVRAKQERLRLVKKEREEKALRMIQGAVRRFRLRRRPVPIHLAADEDPASRPIDPDRMRKHEEAILKKTHAYLPEKMHPLLSQDDLRVKALDNYRSFLSGVALRRLENRRMLLQKHDIRQKIEALEGRNFTNPIPFGQATAAFMNEAEEKHRERKQIMSRNMKYLSRMRKPGPDGEKPGPDGEKAQKMEGIVSLESHTEEAEADALLKALEADLGYDFTPAVNTWEF